MGRVEKSQSSRYSDLFVLVGTERVSDAEKMQAGEGGVAL